MRHHWFFGKLYGPIGCSFIQIDLLNLNLSILWCSVITETEYWPNWLILLQLLRLLNSGHLLHGLDQLHTPRLFSLSEKPLTKVNCLVKAY
jgi:hypothetical protein